MSKGFLGTAASLAADRTLVIESAMGIALIVGTVFARRREYRAHAWCQSTVVLLNLGVIAQFMVPSFRRQVAPEIPASLGEVHYVIATIHGLLGTVAELLALYVVLAAGTKDPPETASLCAIQAMDATGARFVVDRVAFGTGHVPPVVWAAASCRREPLTYDIDGGGYENQLQLFGNHVRRLCADHYQALRCLSVGARDPAHDATQIAFTWGLSQASTTQVVGWHLEAVTGVKAGQTATKINSALQKKTRQP